MFTVVNELLETRRELEKVKEQLRVVSKLILQSFSFFIESTVTVKFCFIFI